MDGLYIWKILPFSMLNYPFHYHFHVLHIFHCVGRIISRQLSGGISKPHTGDLRVFVPQYDYKRIRTHKIIGHMKYRGRGFHSEFHFQVRGSIRALPTSFNCKLESKLIHIYSMRRKFSFVQITDRLETKQLLELKTNKKSKKKTEYHISSLHDVAAFVN